MAAPEKMLQPGDGLLLVDVQVDFCPEGLLAVEEGDMIVPVLNRWIQSAVERAIPVYASRDWHPKRHPSFQSEGGLWPEHCIQDSRGAGFHPDLKLPDSAIIITKGVRFDQDQNSVFDQTGFGRQLSRDGVKRLWVGGLALDVCVLASILDARREGFDVCLIQEATRPVDAAEGEKAMEKIMAAGAAIY